MSKPVEQSGTEALFDGRELVKTVNLLLLILPFFLGILLINRLLEGDYMITTVLSVCILLAFFIRKHLRPSTINIITFLLSIFFVLIVVAICTMRNGIYDVSIVAFPVILGFSSVILRQRELIMTSSLTFLSVLWLILGDRLEWYTRDRVITSTFSDFVVAATFIGMAGILTYVLTSNIRKSIRYANREATRRKVAATALEEELIEKNRLIEEIHQKVTQSLTYIGKLTNGSDRDGIANGTFSSVHRKIICIGSAHEILFQTQNYESVEIESYLRLLLSKYQSLSLIGTPPWTFACDKVSLSLDECISFGLCFLEMVHRALVKTDGELGISVYKKDHLILRVSGSSLADNKSASELIELMAIQLKGDLEVKREGEQIIQKLTLQEASNQ